MVRGSCRVHSEDGVCRLSNSCEARSHIASGTGVHRVRQRDVDLVEKNACIVSGRQHLDYVSEVRDRECRKGRVHHVFIRNVPYVMMHRPVPTEALKAAEDTAATKSSKLQQECDELVTEEDTLHQEQPAAKTRHTSHLEKNCCFSVDSKDVLHTIRSSQASHGRQSVATPNWNSREIYRARLLPNKVYGPPRTLDNVSAGAIAPLHQNLPNWFRWNLFVRFFEVTRELRHHRLWETYLDPAASLQGIVKQPHNWVLGASVLFPRTKPAK